jgi:hypothetical protein
MYNWWLMLSKKPDPSLKVEDSIATLDPRIDSWGLGVNYEKRISNIQDTVG